MDHESDLVLPPRSSPIEIDYATVMLSAAHKVRFRYRLENFEQEWTDAGTRRQALFTNLPPGDYRFRVMAIATDGSSSESTATLRFTVRPAFTQTPWFFAGLGLLLTLALWSAWRMRLRYVQRQFALVINERIRMSREIHDTLLQSLIGVALQLDVLGASASDETRGALTRARRELEEDIRETRQSIWNLRSPKLEQSDLASLLREAGRRIAAGAPVQMRVTVDGTPRRVRLDVEQQVLRIGEQAMVNAVRHASASEVDVHLRFEDRAVSLTVTDNGRGFDQHHISGESNFHFGLASMRERAEELGGRFSLRSEPGRGTAVEAVVPV
ncbi:MAG: triple tyrosine motif-containing protein [Vicinamibacterales bacterium]